LNLFGHFALYLALATSVWAAVGSLLGIVARGRGLQQSAERAILATATCVLVAMGALWVGFLTDDFTNDYVYHYSSRAQALPFKIGALWGGQAGSLLLWSGMLTVMSSVMVLTNRRKNRVLMPWATFVTGTTAAFFMILLNFIESPFVTSAVRPDGVGLNPQLKNFWMMIHPPSLYLGYVGFTIPFAFAIASLATRRTGDIWFRTTRRWTLFAWFFLGIGILLGSYWAYVELGWGGYWAWDPVENASLMPWLVGTAFLHSVMIQEKKGMLKIWNVALIILTFSLSIFGTFLTRSGVISSVHAFATSNIGPAFGIFLGIVFFSSLALLIVRLDDLKSEGRLESLLSRESSFVFNNMILVGIAATVLFLTTFPMLSEAVTGRKVTMGPPIFNLVNIPWAIALLFLVGVGPLIAWRKATASNLRRNFLWPSVSGIVTLVALLLVDAREYVDALGRIGGSLGALDVAGTFDHLKAFYPAITFATGMFVLGTVGLELHRGVRARRHQYGESLHTAAVQLVWRNKRRWGGYIVHVGVVVVFFGIAGSSAYQKEGVRELNPGETFKIDDYAMRYDGYRLEAVDDHVGAVTETTVWYKDDPIPIGRIRAEQRMHPNMLFGELRQAFLQAKAAAFGDPETYRRAVENVYVVMQGLEGRAGREVKTMSTEVGIHESLSLASPSRFGEDFYVMPLWVDPGTGRANFRVFVNPMVNFLWIGGLILIFGAHLSVLPDARERKRLETAMLLEERAAA
jgi:cytochrome c-type biogenesis protein CcmF